MTFSLDHLGRKTSKPDILLAVDELLGVTDPSSESSLKLGGSGKGV
jgi:hypothetical protein